MRARVLIVDDEEWVSFVLRSYFEPHGFEIVHANELEEAEALLSNGEFLAVVSDLRLTGAHGAEGLDLISFVQTHCPSVRTILLTAYGSPTVKEAAERRGADLVLEKPHALAGLARVLQGFREERVR